MDTQKKEVAQFEPAPAPVPAAPVTIGFSTKSGFELMQRAAQLLAASALVPKEYQGNIANCTIALEMAARIGASPLMVMQNLYLVHGKPSWSSQFIIAAINGTGRFSPLRYQLTGDGEGRTCVAWANEKATGERLESPPISITMAKREGWTDRNGSKWRTMPELMLRYRAATLFGRLYAPEILMGMKTYEEVIDIEGAPVPENPQAEMAREKVDQVKEKIRKARDKKGKFAPQEIEDLEPAASVPDKIALAPAECPDRPGDTMTVEFCDGCASRNGCPAWG